MDEALREYERAYRASRSEGDARRYLEARLRAGLITAAEILFLLDGTIPVDEIPAPPPPPPREPFTLPARRHWSDHACNSHTSDLTNILVWGGWMYGLVDAHDRNASQVWWKRCLYCPTRAVYTRDGLPCCPRCDHAPHGRNPCDDCEPDGPRCRGPIDPETPTPEE